MMLGEKINQLRKGLGMSQEELAGQLTVSRQAVSKWELGDAMPDTENIVQLSKLFGVSTDYLLHDEYESDTDIPAVKISNENLKTEYRNRAKIASYWFMGVGFVGILTLWILSFVVVVPIAKLVIGSDGETLIPINDIIGRAMVEFHTSNEIYYNTIAVRGDFGAFLDWYNLSPFFVLCCVAMFIGLILFASSLNTTKNKPNIYSIWLICMLFGSVLGQLLIGAIGIVLGLFIGAAVGYLVGRGIKGRLV